MTSADARSDGKSQSPEEIRKETDLIKAQLDLKGQDGRYSGTAGA